MLRGICDEKMAILPCSPLFQSWEFPSDQFSGEKYIADHFFWLSSRISQHLPSLQPASPRFFCKSLNQSDVVLQFSHRTEFALPEPKQQLHPPCQKFFSLAEAELPGPTNCPQPHVCSWLLTSAVLHGDVLLAQ